jgi:para-aminobenzoate synthetase component 1
MHGLVPKNKTDFPLVILYSFENWAEEEGGRMVVNYRDEKFLESIKRSVNRPRRRIRQLRTKNGFKPFWDREKYKTAFDKAKRYIKSGDVYQINLSYPLYAISDSAAKDIFVQTQAVNQATMAGVFQSDDFDLISLSPETFINIENRYVETFPIKGTRAKRDNISDDLVESSLVNDKKERAELNMISDLLRNDLGIICKPGSVKIKSTRNTTRLSKVIHTYSHITGELNPDMSPIEALLNISPGGSISGCPKKRALEIIDELEEYPRGPYTGSLFTLDAEDNLEASILIRTVVKKGNNLSLPVGGGVVFDSEYRTEYQETLDKASSITEAFD